MESIKINVHQDVQDLLKELNEIGLSLVFGGYLRGLYFDEVPNDVDIVTNIPIEILEQKYSHYEKAKSRTTTSGYDVFSFKMHRTAKIFVEIVSTKSNPFDKSKQADYTINSFLYDGEKLIDEQNGLEDIKNQTIREVNENIIQNDLKTRPYLWLKTLRLVSMTGFKLSNVTLDILDQNKSCVNEISNEIMQTEGHKTMNGKKPFAAMNILSHMGCITPFKEIDVVIDTPLQPHQKLCLLAILSNKQTIDDFVAFYRFNQDLIDKYEYLYSIYNSDERLPNKYRHQIITIKKIAEKLQDNAGGN